MHRISTAILIAFFSLVGGLGVASAATPSPITIHALLWRDSANGPIGRTMAEAVNQFNSQYAGIYRVVPQWVSPGQSAAQLKAALGSANAPDVFMTDYAGLTALAGSGDVYPLSAALAADPFWSARFPSGALQPLTVGGRVLAVPAAISVGVLYFNTRLFSQEGLPLPHTFGDLAVDIPALASFGVTPIAFAGRGTLDGSILADQVAVREAGVRPFEAAVDGRAPWTEPAMLQSAQALDQLAAMGAFAPGSAGMTDAQAVADFENGRAAMLFSSDPRLLTRLESITSPIRGMVEATPFPGLDSAIGGSSTAWVGTPELNLAVSQSSTAKQAALAFVKSLSSPSMQTFIADRGMVPVTTDVLGLHAQAPLLSTVRRYTRGMTAMAVQSSQVLTPAAEQAYQRSINAILAGRDPEAVLAHLDAETRPAAG
jgi:raffinose/stachyose/melibiose transport system substrate-binding protein